MSIIMSDEEGSPYHQRLIIQSDDEQPMMNRSIELNQSVDSMDSSGQYRQETRQIRRQEREESSEEEEEDRSITAKIEQLKQQVSALLDSEPGNPTEESFRLNVGQADFTPEISINGTWDNDDSNEKRAAIFETVGLQDDPSKIALVLKLKIREGVSDAVIERFANVQQLRFMIINAFGGAMYLNGLNYLMSCTTINHKIVDGFFYLILMVDDETFQYRISEEPLPYFLWKAIVELLPKPMSISASASSKHAPASVFDKGKSKVADWFCEGLKVELNAKLNSRLKDILNTFGNDDDIPYNVKEICEKVNWILTKLSGKTINYTYDEEQAENGSMRYFIRDINKFKPHKIPNSYDFKIVSAFEVFGEYFLDHFDIRETEGSFFYSSFKLNLKAECEQIEKVRDFWTARKYIEAATLKTEERAIAEKNGEKAPEQERVLTDEDQRIVICERD